jgi:hypothetical protein
VELSGTPSVKPRPRSYTVSVKATDATKKTADRLSRSADRPSSDVAGRPKTGLISVAKGKPVARRGRKARGLLEMARLPTSPLISHPPGGAEVFRCPVRASL